MNIITKSIKLSISMAVLLLPAGLRAQQPMLERIWETDTVIAIPESVLPDAAGKTLYVSLIDGGGWDADGKGGVGKLGMDGRSYDGGWITGLNAPKGLGRYKNRLYVADISEVVVIDIKRGKIEKKIAIEGAKGLNDITVDARGVVYVSDSKAGKVYQIDKDIPLLCLEQMAGANGLKASGDSLYVLAKKAVLVADASKNIRKLTDLPNGGDGVEEVGNGDLIVSEWAGYIYYVYADGRKELLLDTHLAKKNTADIHYDQKDSILYVPGFNGKTVAAYRLRRNATSAAPRVFLMDARRLEALKKKAGEGDATVLSLVSKVKKQADELLDMRPISVMDKPSTPPSGNKHDYMSQAPYFWYDSSKPNGLPYLRRDGQRNPEIYRITDHKYMGELDHAVRFLSLAWYLSGDNKYALKAAVLLKRWFLDDSTRMNPNLTYAQAIPGINDGRGTGIIESIALMGIADAAGLLEGSPAWATSDGAALRQWYKQYLNWMLTSSNGKDEHAARNNHGTWYLAQAVDFALFTGDVPMARQLAEEGKDRIGSQIDGEGKMALELARTNGLGYSTYNLTAWFRLATLAGQTGVDLWSYHNKEGAGIRTALDWLRPYAMGDKKWEYQQISPYNTGDLYTLLLQASLYYKDEHYFRYAKVLDKKEDAASELLWGTE